MNLSGAVLSAREVTGWASKSRASNPINKCMGFHLDTGPRKGSHGEPASLQGSLSSSVHWNDQYWGSSELLWHGKYCIRHVKLLHKTEC